MHTFTRNPRILQRPSRGHIPWERRASDVVLHSSVDRGKLVAVLDLALTGLH